MFSNWIGKYVIELCIPALIYNILTYKLIEYIKIKSASKTMLEVVYLNNLLVFIYIAMYAFSTDFTKANAMLNIYLPRAVYLLTLIGCLMSWFLLRNRRSKIMFNMLSLIPTLILLMDEGAIYNMVVMLIIINIYTQINKNLDLLKAPQFIFILAFLSNHFYFRTGHRARIKWIRVEHGFKGLA